MLYAILILTIINSLGLLYLVVKVNKYDTLFNISDSNFARIIKLMKTYREKDRNRNKINLN